MRTEGKSDHLGLVWASTLRNKKTRPVKWEWGYVLRRETRQEVSVGQDRHDSIFFAQF